LDASLAALTAQVLASNRMRGNAGALPFASATNPIRHVIYILKENRTYDQILGDLEVGDGDRSLTMYGETSPRMSTSWPGSSECWTTSTIAAMSQATATLWSTAATVTDYTEKTWPMTIAA